MTSVHQPTYRDTVVHVGRAYVQLVASVHVLLERDVVWTERLLLKLVKALYTHRLHRLLELLPDDMVAEILAEQEDSDVIVVPFSSN